MTLVLAWTIVGYHTTERLFVTNYVISSVFDTHQVPESSGEGFTFVHV